ncbi:hypothetical protein [uncultured Shimia sp.]|uniref:hypothetical protein n=1 Tax=uncultured Shimia sp. TaxID=573152 RepID=UPI002627C0D8|nr:hypothetical protein [uncultured Shimia sp.]
MRKKATTREVIRAEALGKTVSKQTMIKTERFVEGVFSELTDLPISLRHDWTIRSLTAKKSVSKGGKYKARFRNYELDAADQFGEDGAGVALRLIRYVDDDTDFDALVDWTEYPSFAADPEIGSLFRITTWDSLRCLVAHEVAHAVDFHQGGDGGHRESWKAIYRDYRKRLGLVRVAPLTSTATDTTCNHCGELFIPARKNTKYCSTKCRVAAHRESKR